jgi:hypothetical protein
MRLAGSPTIEYCRALGGRLPPTKVLIASTISVARHTESRCELEVRGSTLYDPQPANPPDACDVAAPRWYADRDVQGIPGKIIECGDLDNVVDVSGNNSSQSLSVVLDDTDGSIKQIMDAHDIHKRTVRVWQYFHGLDLADKFLLFAGKITTPISWSERDRTVKFTILSQLEDKEVGFSAEEGQFPYLPADLVGKAWPMIFGKCLDVPALQVNHAITGTTLTGVILAGVGVLAGVDAHSGRH